MALVLPQEGNIRHETPPTGAYAAQQTSADMIAPAPSKTFELVIPDTGFGEKPRNFC